MTEAAQAQQAATILITVGAIFLVGLMADVLGRVTRVPRVTLLLIAGILFGPSVLHLLPTFTEHWFPLLTDLALGMIGFLIGAKLTPESLQRLGRRVLVLSLGEVAMAGLFVFAGLMLAGMPLPVALLLAGIAPASAPAATFDVIHETNAKGELTDTLLGIVAVDDAWGIIVFSLLLSVAQGLSGSGGAGGVLLSAAWELFGAIALGLLLALPMAYLTGRVEKGEPTQAEALGFVLLCSGVAFWAEASHILACMTLGAGVASLAKHHRRPFQAIEGIEWPYLILFFLLAGASLKLDALASVGLVGLVYIALRAAGLYLGPLVVGPLSGAPSFVTRRIGLALLPQAGVALGLALVASSAFPEHQDVLLPIVLGSTVVFALIGPIGVRWAITSASEAHG